MIQICVCIDASLLEYPYSLFTYFEVSITQSFEAQQNEVNSPLLQCWLVAKLTLHNGSFYLQNLCRFLLFSFHFA